MVGLYRINVQDVKPPEENARMVLGEGAGLPADVCLEGEP